MFNLVNIWCTASSNILWQVCPERFAQKTPAEYSLAINFLPEKIGDSRNLWYLWYLWHFLEEHVVLVALRELQEHQRHIFTGNFFAREYFSSDQMQDQLHNKKPHSLEQGLELNLLTYQKTYFTKSFNNLRLPLIIVVSFIASSMLWKLLYSVYFFPSVEYNISHLFLLLGDNTTFVDNLLVIRIIFIEVQR